MMRETVLGEAFLRRASDDLRKLGVICSGYLSAKDKVAGLTALDAFSGPTSVPESFFLLVDPRPLFSPLQGSDYLGG